MPAEPDAIPPALIMVPPERAGLRADDFLALVLPRLSRTRIRQKIQMGESLLNGRRYASSARLRAGDVITVFWRGQAAGSQDAEENGGAPAFTVLYEDEHLLAVDKPAGRAVHPVGSIQSGTLIQFLRERLRSATEEALVRGQPDIYPNLVNRLDLFTSGIVLAARDGQTLRAMHALAASGGIEKRYTAVVEGLILQESGRIELPIGPDKGSGIGVKMKVTDDGLPCVTEFAVDRRLVAHTVLHARPMTGRQHQIRVHLAAIGHPVWGDLLYKDQGLFLAYAARRREVVDAAGGEKPLPPRHLLHAEAVSFIHPVTGKRVEVRSELPADFLKILNSLPA